MLQWGGPHGAELVDAPPDAPPIVICPGFGNCTADYAAPFGVQENGIEAALKARLLSLAKPYSQWETNDYMIVGHRDAPHSILS